MSKDRTNGTIASVGEQFKDEVEMPSMQECFLCTQHLASLGYVMQTVLKRKVVGFTKAQEKKLIEDLVAIKIPGMDADNISYSFLRAHTAAVLRLCLEKIEEVQRLEGEIEAVGSTGLEVHHDIGGES